MPYKGAGPALNDLLGGHVDMYFPGFPAATPLLKGGQVKILAVSSAKRAGGAPDVPTVAEAINDPNFDLTLWQGFFAPAGTPPAVVEPGSTPRSTRSWPRPTCRPSFATPAPTSASARPRSSRAFAKAESEKYLQIIKESGVKPE